MIALTLVVIRCSNPFCNPRGQAPIVAELEPGSGGRFLCRKCGQYTRIRNAV